MKRLLIIVLILLIFPAALLAQPVSGAIDLGAFTKGWIFNYQDGNYVVDIFFQGFVGNALVLYLSTSPTNPDYISREIYLDKKPAMKFWSQALQDGTKIYIYPEADNTIHLWKK